MKHMISYASAKFLYICMWISHKIIDESAYVSKKQALQSIWEELIIELKGVIGHQVQFPICGKNSN